MSYQKSEAEKTAARITDEPLEELGLKDKCEEELFAALMQHMEVWTENQGAEVEAAYYLARLIHSDDSYKDRPYIYHLLRVANRLTEYMHITDPEMVIAALLHDSVEDRAAELIHITNQEAMISLDPHELQRQALEQIALSFSSRVARMVACVTNSPSEVEKEESYDEWLERYARKVEAAASTPEGCLIKFADWCDNGLGLVHSEEPEGSPKLAGYKRKYVLALPVFEHRFQDTDVLDMLDARARAYVANQLILGRERLAQG